MPLLVDPIRPKLNQLEADLERLLGLVRHDPKYELARIAWLSDFDDLNNREDLNHVHEERLASLFARYYDRERLGLFGKTDTTSRKSRRNDTRKVLS